MLEDRGALPEEEGERVREYKAFHEDNLLSSWLREDTQKYGRRSGGDEEGQRRRDTD